VVGEVDGRETAAVAAAAVVGEMEEGEEAEVDVEVAREE